MKPSTPGMETPVPCQSLTAWGGREQWHSEGGAGASQHGGGRRFGEDCGKRKRTEGHPKGCPDSAQA